MFPTLCPDPQFIQDLHKLGSEMVLSQSVHASLRFLLWGNSLPSMGLRVENNPSVSHGKKAWILWFYEQRFWWNCSPVWVHCQTLLNIIWFYSRVALLLCEGFLAQHKSSLTCREECVAFSFSGAQLLLLLQRSNSSWLWSGWPQTIRVTGVLYILRCTPTHTLSPAPSLCHPLPPSEWKGHIARGCFYGAHCKCNTKAEAKPIQLVHLQWESILQPKCSKYLSHIALVKAVSLYIIHSITDHREINACVTGAGSSLLCPFHGIIKLLFTVIFVINFLFSFFHFPPLFLPPSSPPAPPEMKRKERLKMGMWRRKK